MIANHQGKVIADGSQALKNSPDDLYSMSCEPGKKYILHLKLGQSCYGDSWDVSDFGLNIEGVKDLTVKIGDTVLSKVVNPF